MTETQKNLKGKVKSGREDVGELIIALLGDSEPLLMGKIF
jgi:hypothetical protein